MLLKAVSINFAIDVSTSNSYDESDRREVLTGRPSDALLVQDGKDAVLDRRSARHERMTIGEEAALLGSAVARDRHRASRSASSRSVFRRTSFKRQASLYGLATWISMLKTSPSRHPTGLSASLDDDRET